MNFDFAKVAPFLRDPLVLVGFFLLIAFGFTRILLKKGIISPLPKTQSYSFLKTLLLYGFIIGILLILLGFGLRFMELSRNESQKAAYSKFLEKVNRHNSPLISEILSVGALAENGGITDSEIQQIEDKFYEVSLKRDNNEIYLQLKDDMNILQLHGSQKVKIFVTDILDVLMMHFENIHLDYYSLETKTYIKKWIGIQKNGIEYGFDSRISDNERLSFILLAKLFDNLIDTMNYEISFT